MNPPVFTLAKADAGVTAVLGTNPTRLYGFGEAPQGVDVPYATWQLTIGTPENYVNQTPDMDSMSVQVDVYGDTSASVLSVATALRNAYEPHAHVTLFQSWPRDPETNRLRYTLQVEFLTPR